MWQAISQTYAEMHVNSNIQAVLKKDYQTEQRTLLCFQTYDGPKRGEIGVRIGVDEPTFSFILATSL